MVNIPTSKPNRMCIGRLSALPSCSLINWRNRLDSVASHATRHAEHMGHRKCWCKIRETLRLQICWEVKQGWTHWILTQKRSRNLVILEELWWRLYKYKCNKIVTKPLFRKLQHQNVYPCRKLERTPCLATWAAHAAVKFGRSTNKKKQTVPNKESENVEGLPSKLLFIWPFVKILCMSSESSKSGSIFVQYICCLSNLSCTASDSRSPSDLPSEAVLIICTSCLVYRCISFYVLVYPCISLILCVYIYLIICMSCFVYPSKSSHILVYPPVYLCFTDYVFQNLFFARTVSTDCFVWVQNNQPSKKIFLHCCMNFEYLSGCRPNRCKQNWKDFLPGSPEGIRIHWPLQATSMSADCERSTLSFQITINIYQPSHNSFAVNTNLMSLSIIVHHCLVYIAHSIAFLCQRLFSPNRKSSRQGKTASLGKVRNIVGGCTWAFPQHS